MQGTLIICCPMKVPLNTFARDASLRRLRALRALVERGSVTGAASALHVSPPAVSLQLRQLEAEVGLRLVERSREGLRVTDAGREVLAAIERIDLVLRDCAEALDAISQGHGGRVVVAVISTAKYFAPRALAAFRKRSPGVDIRLTVGNRQDIIGALRKLEADLAIMGRPPEDVPHAKAAIGEHPHVVIGPPDHWAAQSRTIELRQLAGERFLLREPGSGTRLLAESVFAAAGIQPGIDMEIGSNETIKQAVIAGLGIAFISAHTVDAELRDGRLVVLPVEGLPIKRQWYVVRREDRRLLPAASALWDFLAEEGRRYLPSLGPG